MTPHSFWHFENRWLITATLRMKTALSVGARASLMPTGSDLPVIKTPEGIPFIPGSSLKGVVRSYVERILRTMDELEQNHRGKNSGRATRWMRNSVALQESAKRCSGNKPRRRLKKKPKQ